MEIKLFGKSLFEAKKSRSDMIYQTINDRNVESKYLIDFYQFTNSQNDSPFSDYVITSVGTGSVAVPIAKQKEPKTEADTKITPKGVYQAKLLNDETFELKTDPAYIDEQLADFKDKLGMVKSEEYDMRRGTDELTSIVMRLENRKKYGEFKDFFDEYPYTTTSKIADMTKKHDHLKMGQIAQFVADMPKEATQVMKEYTKQCDELCSKKPVFYIIADKKDFQKSEKRRDPILLAQSPFGHFWQILGAWDEEMLLLEEL